MHLIRIRLAAEDEREIMGSATVFYNYVSENGG